MNALTKLILADTYIPKDELITGNCYWCAGRNFEVGLWTGTEFMYMRYKFGDEFYDTECHWDDGPPHGTAKPYLLIQ